MVTCESCAAKFDATLIRCPYCGTGYMPAEEDEYMDRLEGVRTELEEHKDDAEESLKKGMSATAFTVILLVGMCLLMLFTGMWISRKVEKTKAQRYKQEFMQNQGITEQEDPAK